MARASLLLLTSLLLAAAILVRPASDADEPDTSRAGRLNRWATPEEGERFQSVKGKMKGQNLGLLGHPFAVGRWPDGTEIWAYEWGLDWRITLRKGVCTDTHSNDG